MIVGSPPKVEGDPVARPRRALPRGQGLRTALAVLIVAAATLLGGYGALANVSADRELSIGTIRLSVEPRHRGALDLYVPLVDWGARFEGSIRLPARLHVDVRTLNRTAVAGVASGEAVDVTAVRGEARDAIASYLRELLMAVLVAGLTAGVVAALALRGAGLGGVSLRWKLGAAVVTALAATVALGLLLPPRGRLDQPQYYAAGPSDIPRALQALETAQRSSRTLDQELNAQLVGLARLVSVPARRNPLPSGRPHLTLASDLHNNVLGIPLLERTAAGGPVFFAGDLTDRGTPLETRLTRRVVHTGDPFVFVSGNHDSDALVRQLVDDGAVVLTEHGRLQHDGSFGSLVVRVAGLRVAGYSDPYERRASDGFRDRYEPHPSEFAQEEFATWLSGLIGEVDVVMVHEPELATVALEQLRENPPTEPLVLLVGHTHKPSRQRLPGVTVLNGGSIGAGGTGNLAESGNYGLARLVFESSPRFEPLAADFIQIDPGTGSSTARRERLDIPAFPGAGA